MATKDGRRVVVVTGASAGIGRATAEAFGRQGDAVGLLARGEAGLKGAVADVETAGGIALAVATDMADHEQVDAAAARIEAELGPIDVWVNVAFSSIFAEFTEITPEEFERVTQVTYLGFVNGTRAALRHMEPRNAGVILQTGSALSRRGIPLQSAYCGSKFAINGFTEAVRSELLHKQSKIRLSVVQMPALNTPQFDWVLSRLPKKSQPVPPIYAPEVAARALVHAADHYRREWVVGIPTVATILGNFFLPAFLDHYMARTAYKSQQTEAPNPADSPSNLFAPVDQDEDWSARGRFTDRELKHSLQWKISTKRREVLAATGALAAISAAVLARRK